jgi:F420-dependent oxidoreductase-like protein
LRVPAPSLVVLIGPSGAGKSTWAAANFRPSQVVASDDLRALVGEDRDDQRAGTDAFEVLDLVLERRLRRGLLTVVDTLGLDPARRRQYVALAHRHGVKCHAVLFDTAPDVCRARNKNRSRPVPAKVLTGQLSAAGSVWDKLEEDGFDGRHRLAAGSPDSPVSSVEIVPTEWSDAPTFAGRQKEEPMTLRFGLQLSSFAWPGGRAELAGRLGEIAETAEAVGFSSLWVMDHFLQIPQVGREWEDLLESYTTLGWLAARTSTARLGTLVTGITYRNVGHLAKLIATLDVLSGGRAMCGLGAAWFEREHVAYGWPFPDRGDRLALLEDALQALPLFWGPGAPPFEGRVIKVAEAMCYPRPLQEHVPILIGGSGERRTLRLVAQYGDACNLVGEPDRVRHKLTVLAGHCGEVGRPVEDIEVTHLSNAVVASDVGEVATRLRVRPESPEAFARRVKLATVSDHIGRYRELAEAGVQTAIVSLGDLGDDGAVERFAPVIEAFA